MELKIKTVNTMAGSDGSQYGKFTIEPLERGFGITRKQSRQIVNHGHVLVNGKKVDIPSYLVKAGDVITVKARSNDYLKNVMSMIDLSCTPAWVTLDKDALKITFDRVPEREELDPEIKEQLVIEYYSK